MSYFTEKENSQNHNDDTETLLDICKDVTLNPILRKVVSGTLDLPHNENIVSFDI